MPFPEEFPTYATKNQFIHYLESYAHRFNLKPRFNECVESVHYDKICEMWRIHTENKFAGEETEYICRWLNSEQSPLEPLHWYYIYLFLLNSNFISDEIN